MLLTEGNNDDHLFGSDVEQDSEPHQVQTEPFEFADDLSSSMAQDRIEENDQYESLRLGDEQKSKLKLTTISALEEEAEAKIKNEAMEFNDLIGL